ncbi:nucleoside ABC transporter membrane protein [Streptohalobacillus salinus]|uniref:Nucleoside ABC transporter membrane protein n=1 Tax=Streptohalobacillus salinus TaxID=621096 RepID=A0A2V3WEA3_9BACI|nr:ABC transporter permease [Streptohalobacillus salinus]PXW92475.1 nucleoside ABC transporter membrane protein [Streptohalobacillus salinus]
MEFIDQLVAMMPMVLFYSAPLIFTAIGGVFSERSGVVNIGLEGLMVIGAFSGIVFNIFFADTLGAATPWLSLVAGAIAAGIFSIMHAVAAVSFRANQVVSGVAINMMAVGLGVFLTREIFGRGQTDSITQPFYTETIPFLSEIPIIGDMFFNGVYITSYIAIGVAVLAWFVLYKTTFGLRLRAVGEHPMAADTNGINVTKMRYIAVILSGLLAGLGGATYALTISLSFAGSTISGQGFMSLAAVIFGKWHPLGALGAAVFFGFAQALSVVGNNFDFLSEVPSVYLVILPYVLTVLALAGFIGRAEAPKANGEPYIKGSR